MTMPTDQGTPVPTSKIRNNVQRSVNALLDGLAPERTISRGEEPKKAIEQHRTPTGCVLQAENAAVSVSWFAGAGSDPLLGELQVLVWQGVVTRRGSPRRKEGATVVREMSLRPIEEPRNDRIWRASDSSEYSNLDLAAVCNKLLGQQVAISEQIS
ncbi:MAG TPA: hypothetical protein VJ852_06840 [Gemmatimonadaceae bacterium]|nr:hypothetical protein [Gemmatimonadaceae bacterium]